MKPRPALSTFFSARLPIIVLSRAVLFFAGPAEVGAMVPAGVGSYSSYPAKPVITAQPVATTVLQGQALTLSVVAYANPNPDYQWRKDGANLAGATTSTLTISNAQPANSGTYEVVVSNRLGHVTSSAIKATITATNLPAVTRPPLSQTLAMGQTAMFEIAVSATPAPSYQWRKDGLNLPGATAAALVITNLRPSDGGSYDVYVSNSRGSIISRAATLTILNAPAPSSPSVPEPTAIVAPVPTPSVSAAALSATRITAQPRHVTAVPGSPAALTVTAAGEDLTYQWKKAGLAIPGATASALVTPSVAAGDAGFYSVTVSGRNGTVESAIAIVAVTATEPGRLVNLSARGYVPAGGALTPGFSWRGPGPKNVLVRAIGPTLARFGVREPLADPQLDLIPAGGAAASATNDDWAYVRPTPEITAVTAATGAFAPETGSKDAALVASLAPDTPRNYSVRITSADPSAAGIALAEIYEGDSAPSSGRLAAVSTLGLAGTGDRALVPGFTISGPGPKRLLIRAVGPGLAPFGVFETLPDPHLALHAAGLTAPIATNDDWASDPTVAAASAAVGAFELAPGSHDAALVVTLPPGSYTMAVTGASELGGQVLVEIYDLDP